MKNSVLFQVFESLSPKEIRELGHFIRSPYFNRRDEVSRLYDFIAKNIDISGRCIEEGKSLEIYFSRQGV